MIVSCADRLTTTPNDMTTTPMMQKARFMKSSSHNDWLSGIQGFLGDGSHAEPDARPVTLFHGCISRRLCVGTDLRYGLVRACMPQERSRRFKARHTEGSSSTMWMHAGATDTGCHLIHPA